MRSLTLIAAATALTAGGLAATPAEARHKKYDRGYEQGYNDARYADRRYGTNGYYGHSQRDYAPRYRCRSGTTGAIVGGAAGALLGREVAGRGSRTLGTILGGAGGALLGREITRDKRCR